MRVIAETYSDGPIVKQPVTQLPWGHVIQLIQKVKDPQEREWYSRAVFEHGWSRAALVQVVAGCPVPWPVV